MTVKVLQCSDVLDSECTLVLIGEAEEIAEAFAAHLHRHDSSIDVDSVIAANLQRVVFLSRTKAYIGDSYEYDADTNTIRLPGAGMIIQQFAGSEQTDAGGATLQCKCQIGSGSCKLRVLDHAAFCDNNTCSSCSFTTDIQTVVDPPDQILKA